MGEITPHYLDKQQFKLSELFAAAQEYSQAEVLADADHLIALYTEAIRRFLREKEGLVGIHIEFDSQVHLNGQGRFVVKILKKNDRYFRIQQGKTGFRVYEVFLENTR